MKQREKLTMKSLRFLSVFVLLANIIGLSFGNTVTFTYDANGGVDSTNGNAWSNDSVSQCNLGDDFILPTPPAKMGYDFDGWRVKESYSYTQLDYIECGQNLDAYIDLGYPATTQMRTLLTASFSTTTNGVTDDQVLFGASDQTVFANGYPYAIDRFAAYTLIPNGGNYVTNTVKLNISTSVDTIYDFGVNYPTLTYISVDNTTKRAQTNINMVSSQNLYLCGFNGAGTYSTHSIGQMRFYGLKIWNGDTLIHDYIPVININNVPGIYDTVGHEFLTNAGSGDFVVPSQSQQCDINEWDDTIQPDEDGDHIRWKPMDGGVNEMTMMDHFGYDNSDDLNPGELAISFDFGTIMGETFCGDNFGNNDFDTTGDPGSEGQYCWYHITQYTPTGGEACSPEHDTWVYIPSQFSSTEECKGQCPFDSTQMFLHNDNFRNILYSVN